MAAHRMTEKRQKVRRTSSTAPRTVKPDAEPITLRAQAKLETSPTDLDAPFCPYPVHFRLLDAYEGAFQDGQAPVDGVIAKRMGVRRETICRWRRGNPALRRWIFESIGRAAEERRPFVDRRVTSLAESGSVEHAKLYYQYVDKVGRPDADDDRRIVVNHNYLIPRPDYAGAAAAEAARAALPPVSTGPPPASAAAPAPQRAFPLPLGKVPVIKTSFP